MDYLGELASTPRHDNNHSLHFLLRVRVCVLQVGHVLAELVHVRTEVDAGAARHRALHMLVWFLGGADSNFAHFGRGVGGR
jgi:hypothetical protein